MRVLKPLVRIAVPLLCYLRPSGRRKNNRLKPLGFFHAESETQVARSCLLPRGSCGGGGGGGDGRGHVYGTSSRWIRDMALLNLFASACCLCAV